MSGGPSYLAQQLLHLAELVIYSFWPENELPGGEEEAVNNTSGYHMSGLR